MRSFIVMQGDTYPEEKDLGIIWTPQLDRRGMKQHSWERMKEVETGDRIFHYVKGEIVAISIVREGCTLSSKPAAAQMNFSDEEGYLVNLEYFELDSSLKIRENFTQISPVLPVKYSPFQEDTTGNHGYLYPCNEELAIKLLDLISERNIYLVNEEQLEFSIDVIRSTEHDALIPVIVETESELKAKIRMGLEKVRKEMLPLWQCKCALCDIDLSELLTVSQSKPWKDSTNHEKADPYNGVLLCSNHAALYNNGLIAFDGQGRLHISLEINQEDYLKYGLTAGTKIMVHPENKIYFKWHKKNIFR
ncbi:HNH endonuclease [Peribacillus sp. SCS-155]|uniref:HNH endonuclease n=1 Tax=Peribacillus sedimenti TaxID=3115297 RepID=UPI003905CBEA